MNIEVVPSPVASSPGAADATAAVLVIERLGVIGAGQMGNGIAHVCAVAGLPVRLLDVKPEALDRALSVMAKNMDRQVARGVITAEQKEAALARVALVSEAHFIRSFRAVFGETPHRYLQRRRIERAMTMLRHTDRPVTDIAFAVGFHSPGTFSRTFQAIVGRSPSAYRHGARPLSAPVPTCFLMRWSRPSSFGEATVDARP